MDLAVRSLPQAAGWNGMGIGAANFQPCQHSSRMPQSLTVEVELLSGIHECAALLLQATVKQPGARVAINAIGNQQRYRSSTRTIERQQSKANYTEFC